VWRFFHFTGCGGFIPTEFLKFVISYFLFLYSYFFLHASSDSITFVPLQSGKYMKHLIVTFTFLIVCFALKGQTTLQDDQYKIQLAQKYFSEGDFEKAAPLMKEVYSVTTSTYYFRMYLQCLIELQQFEQAENEIRREIKKTRNSPPELLVSYGYLLKMQKREDEATEKYEEAIRSAGKNKVNYIMISNTFIQWREFEMAEKVLLKGQKEIPGEQFLNELSQIYLYLRNYSQLIEVLLEQVKLSEQNLPRVESMLTSALYLDIENGLREEFRSIILKKIQSEPDVIGYSRLLIWYFLQEKQFSSALRQAIALDRRTKAEEQQILGLAQMALNNQDYENASVAYDYILAKGKSNPAWLHAFYYKMHSDYLNFTSGQSQDLAKAAQISGQFEEGLEILGYNGPNTFLIREYAHLLAFHLNDTQRAVKVIERGLKAPALKAAQVGELKSELADVYLIANDPWEATLLYAQAIDANRDNALGDEVKLKKARLAYYLGNFDWAKAQLDVLKASTSKLTANDAMELSLFIGNNSNLDTTEIPLRYFSRADLLFFMNKNREALTVLDSLEILFPENALIDDILFRKAKIELREKNYVKAIGYLDKIISEYSTDLLADDALFLLGETWQYKLNDMKKASEAYRKIMFDIPGSIYNYDARNRYRALNGDSNESVKTADPDSVKRFFDGKSLPGNQ
jgi:TolA-binding protein